MRFNDRQRIKMFNFMKAQQEHKNYVTWKVSRKL